MNRIFKRILLFIALINILSCSNTSGIENVFITLKTTLGDIKLKLYDATPAHRNNFIKLANSGIYDGVTFHRVINEFMIQAGDPATKTESTVPIADSLKTYTIPSEINPLYIHKKGALAAARQGNEINPEMRSSGTQFYIVQGKKFTDEELNSAEQRINGSLKQNYFNKLIRQTADSLRKAGKPLENGIIQEIASNKMFQYLSTAKNFSFTPEQRNIYKTIGGSPVLDMSYTVFGEVVEGLDVVDKIAAVSTDVKDKPLTDVRILKVKITNK
jgi:peptidylprolyl isomerase